MLTASAGVVSAARSGTVVSSTDADADGRACAPATGQCQEPSDDRTRIFAHELDAAEPDPDNEDTCPEASAIAMVVAPAFEPARPSDGPGRPSADTRRRRGIGALARGPPVAR
jgi:hypothetical protein